MVVVVVGWWWGGGGGGWGWGWWGGGWCLTLCFVMALIRRISFCSAFAVFLLFTCCMGYYGIVAFQYRTKLTSITQQPDISVVIGRLRFFSLSRKSAFQNVCEIRWSSCKWANGGYRVKKSLIEGDNTDAYMYIHRPAKVSLSVWDILCGISKGTKIPHKKSHPYIERCVVCLGAKTKSLQICELESFFETSSGSRLYQTASAWSMGWG